MRLSIELSPEQHHQIKAMAALQGKSMKDWVLEKLFSEKTHEEDIAWLELKAFLKQRIQEAQNSQPITMTVNQIAEEVLRRNNAL